MKDNIIQKRFAYHNYYIITENLDLSKMFAFLYLIQNYIHDFYKQAFFFFIFNISYNTKNIS